MVSRTCWYPVGWGRRCGRGMRSGDRIRGVWGGSGPQTWRSEMGMLWSRLIIRWDRWSIYCFWHKLSGLGCFPRWVSSSLGIGGGEVGHYWRDRGDCIVRNPNILSVLFPIVPIRSRSKVQYSISDKMLGITVAGVPDVSSVVIRVREWDEPYWRTQNS